MALIQERQLQHIGVSTSNQKQTLTFFEAMGFSRFYESINPVNAAPVVFMRLDDIVLEVYSQQDSISSPGVIDHIAVTVNDIDEKYAQVCTTEYGILEDGVKELPFWENGVRYFTVRGPCGEKLEFCQIL